jgi:ribose transport system substrate-binding protein
MALGIIDAIDYTRIQKPLIVSYDATEKGLSMVEKGEIDALVDQKPGELGKMAVENALRLIKGESVASPQMTNTELVTKESLPRPFQK